MTIQDLGSLGELIAAIATLATLAYLAVQIRQNTRSVRSATSASVAESLSRWAETIGSQRDLTHLWMQGIADPEQLEPEAKIQFSLLSSTYVRRLENAFYQHSAGFLDPDHWQTTQRFSKYSLVVREGGCGDETPDRDLATDSPSLSTMRFLIPLTRSHLRNA